MKNNGFQKNKCKLPGVDADGEVFTDEFRPVEEFGIPLGFIGSRDMA